MARTLHRLARSTAGNSAVEMALVTPLLMGLMFGSFELGNYFLSEHVLVVAVRDGARYAARRSFAEYSCSAASGDVVSKTQNLTRTGQIASGGTARLVGWTSAATITVNVACDTSAPTVCDGSSPAACGIYTNHPGGAPLVTVSATVPYHSLFQSMGLGSLGLNLTAQSQAAVMGV